MVTNVSSWKCDINFINNTVIAKSPVPLYQIPMLPVLGSAIQQANYDIYDVNNRYVEVGTNYEGGSGGFDGGVFGRLKQVCSTECAVVRTQVSQERLSLRPLCAEYAVDNLICNPDYGLQEELNTILPEIRNTSARQIERFAYLGYSGVPQLSDIPGLRGLADISTAFTAPPTLPIASNDYQSLCEFFTNGINQARTGNVSQGYEFARIDISVHVSSDIVDKINCSILANTTVGLWDQLLSSTLSGISVVISDQISNTVYFVNNRRILGRYNYILSEGQPYSWKGKTVYMMLLGTISFNPLSTAPPVILATNVLS